LTCTAQCLSAFTKIFDNGAGTTFHGEDTRHFQDNIFRGSPAIKLSSQFNTDQLWKLEFPGHARHHINSISASHADGNHAKTSGIYSVRIGSDHHATRERIVFQHY